MSGPRLDLFHGGLNIAEDGLGFREAVCVGSDFFERRVEEDFELGLEGKDGIVAGWWWAVVVVTGVGQL